MKLEEKRKLGRYRLRPTGPREKEFKEDQGPSVSVVIKGNSHSSHISSVTIKSYEGRLRRYSPDQDERKLIQHEYVVIL